MVRSGRWTTRSKPTISIFLHQGGQAVIEAVLAVALFVSIAILVAGQFKERQVFANLISGPWSVLDGMIKNGAWSPRDESNTTHPSRQRRHTSTQGDPAQ